MGPTSRVAHAGPGGKETGGREGGRRSTSTPPVNFGGTRNGGRVARFFRRGNVGPGLVGSGAHLKDLEF